MVKNKLNTQNGEKQRMYTILHTITVTATATWPILQTYAESRYHCLHQHRIIRSWYDELSKPANIIMFTFLLQACAKKGYKKAHSSVHHGKVQSIHMHVICMHVICMHVLCMQ